MANNKRLAEVSKATQWKPGQSPNPGGKPAGARNRLQGDFLNALAEDFSNNGRVAIERTREETPAQYVKIIASLMPKELEIKRPLEELTDDDLIAAVDALQSFISTQAIGVGNKAEKRSKQVKDISSVH